MIVSTVLLYGSDTWVVTRRMEELLTSFHDRCLRHITRRFIRCTDTENDIWVSPSLTGVLAEALLLNLRPAMYYVRARRNGLLRYAITPASSTNVAYFRIDSRVPELLSGTN